MRKETLKNIFKTTIFILVVSGAVLILNKIDFIYTLNNQELFRKEDAYQTYIKTLQNKEINYAFFGDSHPDYAIDPEYISGAYNFSSLGENYIKTYFKFKKIMDVDNVKLDNAVFEIDMHTFSTAWDEKDNLFDELYYYSMFVPLKEISSIKNESFPSVWIQATFPSFGRGVDFINVFRKPNLTEIYRGWTKNTKDYSLSDKNKDAETTYEAHFAGQDRISPITLTYFTKSLELAKARGVHVFLIMYPISYEYNQALIEHGITRDDYYKTILDKTKSILGDKFTILDYHDLFFYHPEYFADTHHLNYIGAEVLSRKISEDLTNKN